MASVRASLPTMRITGVILQSVGPTQDCALERFVGSRVDSHDRARNTARAGHERRLDRSFVSSKAWRTGWPSAGYRDHLGIGGRIHANRRSPILVHLHRWLRHTPLLRGLRT